MRYLLPLSVLLLVFTGCLNDDDNPVGENNQVSSITVTDQAAFPEGLAVDTAANMVYTGSSVDGTIYAGGITDGRLQELSLDGEAITAALGMEIAGDTLYIAGGDGTTAYVVNLKNSQARVVKAPSVTAGDSSFVNDVTISSNGIAYLTNSYSPVIYRYEGGDSMQVWLDLKGSAITYGRGFNLNGIAISDDDRYLLVVQSNTGKLYRIDTSDKSILEVNLQGGNLGGADGIDLASKNVLYVAANRNNAVVTVVLNNSYSVAEIAQIFTGGFLFPSAVAAAGDSLLVLNAQLDKRAPGSSPVLPFTISKFKRR